MLAITLVVSLAALLSAVNNAVTDRCEVWNERRLSLVQKQRLNYVCVLFVSLPLRVGYFVFKDEHYSLLLITRSKLLVVQQCLALLPSR